MEEDEDIKVGCLTVYIPDDAEKGVAIRDMKVVCECECGNFIEVGIGELIKELGFGKESRGKDSKGNGKLKYRDCGCGCYDEKVRLEENKKKYKKYKRPEQGDMFGRLLCVGDCKIVKGEKWYLCYCCECDTEGVWVNGYSLVSGRTKSCGCMRGKNFDSGDGSNDVMDDDNS